jgi:tRNA (guanine37-N1)-methyltransferase
VTRLRPGVLGAEGAAERESFASGLLESPQYTRPEEFRGAHVPAVLLSGDHGRIAKWRQVQALWRTWTARPDLLEQAALSPADWNVVERFKRGETPEQIAAPARRDQSHGRDPLG